jgi:hypothetical protein
LAEEKETFLTYKGRPLVRCGKEIYYGSMSDPYVACFRIQSEKDFKDITLSDKIIIQILRTDPELSLKDKVVKKAEKQGLYNALDLGAIWLERELKK